MNIRTRPPMLTLERSLEVRAFSALIDKTLFDPDDMSPRFAAQNLLAELSTSGKADVTSTVDGLRMTMLGITASSAISPHALFRDWQDQAKDRLAMGAQR
jgi:hypothetical protein